MTMRITKALQRITLLLFTMVLSAGFLLAQEKTVTGVITTPGEGSLPGVSIVIQGTTVGTISDINGNYSIKVPGPSAVLVFSSVGFVSQSIAVGSQIAINVILESDVKAISEVVVTGYSTQRKRDITGAVGVVKTDEIKTLPVGNITNQLQGHASGVTVVGDGQPGSVAKLRIRGPGSFENNDPLYVVDGIPTTDISYLNPNDVASISVLKDAGAASIYGSRASSGVIVITTKTGAKGVKITYDMFTGFKAPGAGPTEDLLTAPEYAKLQWLVYKNDATVEVHPLYGDSKNANPTMPKWAANTDWYDVITDNAPMTNHDLTMSGGNDNATFFLGLGVFQEDGIILYTNNDKYTARVNSDFKTLNNKLKIGENFSFRYGTNHGVANLGEGSPIQMGPYRSQSIVPHVITASSAMDGTARKFVAGEFGGTGMAPRLGNNSNAYADLVRGKDNGNYFINMIGNIYADVSIMKGLNFRTTLGGTWYNGHNYSFTQATYERSENVGTPSMYEQAYYGGSWTWTNQLTFERTFGDHKIAALAGYASNKLGIGRSLDGSSAGYFSSALDYRSLSNGQTVQDANSYVSTPVTLVSQFAKADYAFREKYILSATIRRDGSSVFGKDNKYAFFPSFAAGWQIGDESFLDGVNWLDQLKIRGSWGQMGNQNSVSADNAFYLFGGDAGSAFYDITGTGNSSLQGFRPTRIGNPNAKWETNESTDIGFEALLFKNKIGIVFDWYSKQTKDLLFNPELPGTAGAATQPYVNVASMSNKGIDVELTYKDNFGKLGVNVTGTFTSINNEITKIAEGFTYFDYGGSRIGAFNRNAVGHPLAAFYGYQVDGLFKTAAEVTAAPVQDGAEAGFFRYANLDQVSKDANGKQIIDPKDRTFIGDPNPDFTYGLNIGLTYKSFDLNAFFYGSQGNEILNFNRWWIDFWPSFQGQKSKDLLYNSWTTSNTNTAIPKASNKSNFSTNTVSSSYYVEDGSYLRLKTLQIGYTLPVNLLSKIYVKNLRVYVQGVNLFTATKYTGLDPEIGGDDRSHGVDSGNYPMVKQFIFGLNLSL
jgi:TonB-dependent starch-binding outer membrane protein SusC